MNIKLVQDVVRWNDNFTQKKLYKSGTLLNLETEVRIKGGQVSDYEEILLPVLDGIELDELQYIRILDNELDLSQKEKLIRSLMSCVTFYDMSDEEASELLSN